MSFMNIPSKSSIENTFSKEKVTKKSKTKKKKTLTSLEEQKVSEFRRSKSALDSFRGPAF
jgi:hypothetical protein